MTRIDAGRLIACVVLVVVSPIATAVDAPTRVAVLADATSGMSDSPIQPLLETALAEDTSIHLIERQQIAHVLREQQLTALFGADAVKQRGMLGKLLKADLLVMLRQATPSEGKPFIDVVVCETTSGLRLATGAVEDTGDAEAEVALIKPLVTRGIAKGRERITEVCAVPTFVSNDLTFDFVHLKAAYAKLIEQMLLDKKGVLVVELAEAQAIAKEWALVGRSDPSHRRRMPLMFIGEYRTDGDHRVEPAKRFVNVTIEAQRGESVVGKLTRDNLEQSAAAQFVRESAAELYTKAGAAGGADAAPVPADLKAEAAKLASRGMDFFRLANWSEAVALFEASLLLNPDQPEVHRHAMIGLGRLARGEIWTTLRTVEQVEIGSALYFRGLEHYESLLRAMGHDEMAKYRQPGGSNFVNEFRNSANGWGAMGHPSDEVLRALDESRHREIDLLVRIARARTRESKQVDTVLLTWSAWNIKDHAERFDFLFKIVAEFQDLPNPGQWFYALATHGYAINILDTDAGRKFLDRAAALDNPDVRKVAIQLKEQVPQAARKLREQIQATTQRFKNEPQPQGETEVEFVPLEIRIVGETRHSDRVLKTIYEWMPVPGHRADLISSGAGVYLMRKKGEVSRLWEPSEPNVWTESLCFDGRYIWTSVRRNMKSPVLVAIDSESGEVIEFTSKDGIPVIDQTKDARPPSQTLKVAPISPGKACVAGYLGNSWLGVATVQDATMRKSVNVFHEARLAPNGEDAKQWHDTRVRFVPGYMLSVADADGKQPPKILIQRNEAGSETWYHPLVVNAADLSVTALTDKVDPGPPGSFAVHEGAAYWAWSTMKHTDDPSSAPTLWKLAYPNLVKTEVAQRVYEGKSTYFSIAFHEKRVFVSSRDQLWFADQPSGPYRRLSGRVKEYGQYHHSLLHRSNLYGLLVCVEKLKAYEVRFSSDAFGQREQQPSSGP